MARNLLTDKEFRSAKPREKDYRLRDGDGLFVLVAHTGGKSFQYRYKLNGVPGTTTLKGVSSLAEARREVEPLRRMVAAGDHPKSVKRIERDTKAAANAQTFKVIAAAWVKSEAKRVKWSADYVGEVEKSLRNHLSELDAFPISTIVAKVTAPIIAKVAAKAPAMEEKVSRRLHAVMDFAVEVGALERNPLPIRRRGKVERNHYPAVTTLEGVGAILRAARTADPCKGIHRAHHLLAFEALRVSEVVGAQWDEFDLAGVEVAVGGERHKRWDGDAGNWSVPRERMKRKDTGRGPHVVPLPPKLLELLRAWRRADGSHAVYVCPAPRDATKPITPEAVEKHYRNALSLGGQHSPHSWRSAFSTICRDAGKDGDSIEAQLDHVVGTKVAAAYDRAARLELRRELMTWYESTLLGARDGATVHPIDARRSGKLR